jgi:NAD(P)-dependent dehydrogenase (short-subunit alcohol dehydrogenase family)
MLIIWVTGRIDLLALNAGVGPRGSWADTSYFHKIIDVNLFGVVNGIATFLPSMQETASLSNPAAIIITGSKQGLTNPPGNPAYNASKAAIRTLAEHLSYDLRAKDGGKAPINVHLLVPGWTFTGMTSATAKPGSAEGKPPGAWLPEQVVDHLEKKMAEEQFWVICPDNDVTEEMDRKRILWSVGDYAEKRPPLSRWRPEFKDKFADWMDRTDI